MFLYPFDSNKNVKTKKMKKKSVEYNLISHKRLDVYRKCIEPCCLQIITLKVRVLGTNN